MDLRTAIRKLYILIPANCFYILSAVHTGLHAPQTIRLLPFYMLAVFLLNCFFWMYWDSPILKRTPAWRRIVRFCVWSMLFIDIPIVALAAVEARSVSLAATAIYTVAFNAVAFWISNAKLSNDKISQ